ncbi:MAG: 50S ribosomal protein L3 [Pirellulales bacterium]
MPVGLLGQKVGMTQIFEDDGTVVPVTVIQAGPCTVLQLRTKEKDGYEAVQLGFLDKPRRLASRSQRGHVAKLESKRSRRRSQAGVEAAAKADCEPQRFIREVRTTTEGFTIGQKLTVEAMEQIGCVDVVGISKGRGTAGVMKRHNFSGQRATHGVKKCHRHGGSTGQNTSPARVFKNKKMAGRYGNARITARNLKVVRIDKENNLLLLRGAVPGPNGGYVSILQTNMK